MGAWIEQNSPTFISLLAMLIGGIVAFVVLRERQSAFEKACAKEFAAVGREANAQTAALTHAVTEIGRDVKQLIAWKNRQQGIDEGRRVGRRHDDDMQTGDV